MSLLDCLDRNHPSLLQFQNLPHAKSRDDGTGRFFKDHIDKPSVLRSIPRRYGQYGLPFSIVEAELKTLSPPNVIFVTSGMTYWYPGVVEMISLLKNHFPNIPVFLGGIYATLFPDHARKMSGADAIVIGEGEKQGLQIADEVTGNRSDIERYDNLNDYPVPAYHLYGQLDSAALLTSRGCPYRCPFCASHILSGTYRRRHPSPVVNEIESIHRKKNVRNFAFYDDALLLKKEEHLVPILEEVIERKIHVRFHTPNGIQPREIDDVLARLMIKAGFKTVRLSYESRNKNRQRSMGSKVDDEDLIKAVRILTDVGFNRQELGSYVIMGLPGQEVEEVIDSMMFVLGLGIKVSLASFSPIPGTPYWEEIVKSGAFPSKGDPLLTNNSIFPLQSANFDYNTFLKLGTLSGIANWILNQNGDPLVNPSFVNPLKNLLKNNP